VLDRIKMGPQVSTFGEVATALQKCIKTCAALENHFFAGQAGKSYALRLALLEHLLVRVNRGDQAGVMVWGSGWM
jgi:hypothetical protein